MMSSESFRVCAVDDIRDGAAAGFDVGELRVCVVHIGDDWFAVNDVCSHADFPLSDGEVWADECEIECPKHGALFSLRTGEPQTLPATVPVAVYGVNVQGDDVMVTI